MTKMQKNKKHQRKKNITDAQSPKMQKKSIKGKNKTKKNHNRHSGPKIDTQYMNRMVLSMY